MNLHPLKACALAFIAAVSFHSMATAADAPAPFNKWRVELSGGHATDSGQVQFRVTPHEGEPILVTAKIARGRGETFVAQDMRDAFKEQLPKKRFGSEIVAGQQVLVKARSGEADFVVEIVDSAVPGLRIHVTRG